MPKGRLYSDLEIRCRIAPKHDVLRIVGRRKDVFVECSNKDGLAMVSLSFEDTRALRDFLSLILEESTS